MPAGGLMQLVAYGAQDVYLTGQPKVTFFQSTYKRHTNFAMECVQQTLSGSGGNSGLFSVTLARTGDLVGDMFVALTPTVRDDSNLTSTNSGVDMSWVAERAITSIDLSIGGQLHIAFNRIARFDCRAGRAEGILQTLPAIMQTPMGDGASGEAISAPATSIMASTSAAASIGR